MLLCTPLLAVSKTIRRTLPTHGEGAQVRVLGHVFAGERNSLSEQGQARGRKMHHWSAEKIEPICKDMLPVDNITTGLQVRIKKAKKQ